MAAHIKPGTCVTYSAAFLKSIQGHELAQRRGIVRYLTGPVACVEWRDNANGFLTDGTHVGACLVSNLVPVDRIHLEAV